MNNDLDQIENADDDLASPPKGGSNTIYIVIIVVIALICVAVVAFGFGGKKKVNPANADLETRVESYEPSVKQLVLPKDAPKDERIKELSLEEEKAEEKKRGLLQRPRSEAVAVNATAGEGFEPPPPIAPPAPAKTQDELREEKKRKDMWEQRRQASPVVFNSKIKVDNGDQRVERRETDVDAIAESVRRNAAAGGGDTSNMRPAANNLSRDDIEGRPAGKRVVATFATNIQDQSFMLTQGVMLDCILETAINSELPGYTRCILSEDVHSYDGSMLLLKKGSRVVGQYQGGIQQGETRIFVMWTRILTPDGIDVALDSPGTSPLGASGHDAYIDSHFLERFGSSALLSIVGGLAASESEGDVRLQAAGDSFNKSAEIALQNSIKIRPTGHKNQGDRIKIFVAKDIDFEPAIRIARQ